LPRAPSNLALNTSRDGASTASLGNWLKPAGTQLLAHSSQMEWGRGSDTAEARELGAEIKKDSLPGKAKAVHGSEAKRGIQLVLPISRQMFSHSQESRTHF